jgi:hypothetical protein
MTAGGQWTYVGGYLGAPCPGQIPVEVEQLWRLTYPPECSAATSAGGGAGAGLIRARRPASRCNSDTGDPVG